MTTRMRGSAVDVVEGDRGSLPAFVDRVADIQELQQAWRRAVGGKRQVVLLAGEPGMGKTTLVERLAREVVGAGGRVLWGTCPPDPSTPYAPVAEILARAAAVAPTDVVSRYGVLAHIAPGLGARTSHVPPVPSDRQELFHAAAGLIAELAARNPILLVVDDLHRAHRSTVRLLQSVLAATRELPMLVVGTYCDTSVDRAHAVSSLLADLSGDPDVAHKVLDGLPLEAVRDILPNPAVVDTLWTRAEGNPLFLGELLRHVGTALPTVDPRTLPQSVDAGVARRLARMDAGTRQLLAVAAIIGPEFSLDTIARTGEVPPDRLLAAAEEAVAGEIIEPEGQPNRYRFVHDAVRSAVEHRVAANRGIQVHGRLAEELEKTPAVAEDHLVQLAFHAAGAAPVGGSVSAAAHAAKAGDHALAQLAFDEAAEWYGAGLGLLVGHSRDSAQLKCQLLVSLGDAHDRAGEQVRARHSFLEAVNIARTVNDPGLISLAESALSRSPWPVPVHKPTLSKIPVGTQNQHPFLMPEPPPAKLLPLGELLATASPTDGPPAHGARRSTPQVAAEQEMRAAAHRAAAAAAAAEAAAHPSTPRSAPAESSNATAKSSAKSSAKSKTSAKSRSEADAKAGAKAGPRPVPRPSRRPPRASPGRQRSRKRSWLLSRPPPRARRRPAAPPVAAVARPRPMAEPYTPDDLSELWADPEPASTPMGWSEAPWDDEDHTPASRHTGSRLSALRARHSRPWGPEDVDERLKASEQIVAIAEATDDGDLAMEGYAWRIADRMEMGRLSQADEDIASFSNLANAIGDPIYRRDAAAYATMRAILEGRWDDARSALLDVKALAERVGRRQGDARGTRAAVLDGPRMGFRRGRRRGGGLAQGPPRRAGVGRPGGPHPGPHPPLRRGPGVARDHIRARGDGPPLRFRVDADGGVRPGGGRPGPRPPAGRHPAPHHPALRGSGRRPDGRSHVPRLHRPICGPGRGHVRGLGAGRAQLRSRGRDEPQAGGLPGSGPHPSRVGLGPDGPGPAGRQQAGREPPRAGPRPGRRARHAAPGRRHPGQAGREMTSSMRLADSSSSTAR